jgi:DNA-binding transcriptional LysR family regulator
MDFDQLRTFLEVAKLGSFSRAGQKVFRSQSAVSAQVRQLEEEYEERLLDRSGKTVRLTPAGEVFAEYARRMLTVRDESLRAVLDQGTHPRGVLAIGANEATCLYVLPDVFVEYVRQYPAVQISVYRSFSHKILERLDSGLLDVGIVTLPAKSSTLKVTSIYRDRLMLMVSADNPLARFDKVSVSQIVQQPVILPRTGYTRQILDRLFRPHRTELNVRMELPSVGMIKSFVAAGLGVSLITASFARDEVEARRVKLVGIKGIELWRELGLAVPRNRSLPRAAQVFVELIKRRTGQAMTIS